MDTDELHALRDARAALTQLDGREPSEVEGTAISIHSDATWWRGPFAVDDLAVSCVVAALESLAVLVARDRPAGVDVDIDAAHASAMFWAEALVEPDGWTIPPVWDPIAGDYEGADGWIRLHTNYAHHRTAALAALGLPDSAATGRDEVAATVANHRVRALESAVIERRGVAGACRSPQEWATSDAGAALAAEPLLVVDRTATTHVEHAHADPLPAASLPAAPLRGVRVLDLTRVLAGPTATGMLAAWGAEVLRIDPVGFEEVPAIIPVVGAGKRTAALDLRDPAGRDRLDELVASADVVVHGYRGGALSGLGISSDRWHEQRPGLVEVSLDAFGWTGPWRTRRGFDSIVQHCVGITTTAAEAVGADRPTPLPCQALDHGAGWLLAAAALRGLAARRDSGTGSRWRTSLARVAALLTSIPGPVPLARTPPTLDAVRERCGAAAVVVAATDWGPLRRLAWPGTIDGAGPTMGGSGPLGRHLAAWSTDR
jgi:hypothetical protein